MRSSRPQSKPLRNCILGITALLPAFAATASGQTNDVTAHLEPLGAPHFPRWASVAPTNASIRTMHHWPGRNFFRGQIFLGAGSEASLGNIDLWAYQVGSRTFVRSIHSMAQELVQEMQEFDGGLYINNEDCTGQWSNIHVLRDGVWQQRNYGPNNVTGEHARDIKRFQGKLFTPVQINNPNRPGIRISDDDGLTWREATGGPSADYGPFRFFVFRGQLYAACVYGMVINVNGGVSRFGQEHFYKYTPDGPQDFVRIYSSAEEAGLEVFSTFTFLGHPQVRYKGFEALMMNAREVERPDGLYFRGARLWKITQMEPTINVVEVPLPGFPSSFPTTGTPSVLELKERHGILLVMLSVPITSGPQQGSHSVRILASVNGSSWSEVARMVPAHQQRGSSFEWFGGDLFVSFSGGTSSAPIGMLYRIDLSRLQHLPDLTPPTVTRSEASAADAHTFRQSANTNYGGSTTLRVCGGWNARNAYLRFAPPKQGQVVSAKLRLYGGRVSGSGNVPVELRGRAAGGDWQEGTLTFNNAPSPSGTALGTRQVNAAAWHEWDVTNFVENWEINGATGPLEFVLTTTSTSELSFHSKENAANRPELEIRWFDPGPTPAVVGVSTQLEHGNFGPIPIALNTDGRIIDPRKLQPGGALEVLIDFDLPVSSVDVEHEVGSGEIDSGSISGQRLTVQLRGLENRRWFHLRVVSVNGQPTDQLLVIGVLRGDVSGDGAVTSADLLAMRPLLGRSVADDPNSARADLDGNGFVTTADLLLLRQQLGNHLP